MLSQKSGPALTGPAAPATTALLCINANNYMEDKQKLKHNMHNHTFTTANYFNS